jgi:hypothetical protein
MPLYTCFLARALLTRSLPSACHVQFAQWSGCQAQGKAISQRPTAGKGRCLHAQRVSLFATYSPLSVQSVKRRAKRLSKRPNTRKGRC